MYDDGVCRETLRYVALAPVKSEHCSRRDGYGYYTAFEHVRFGYVLQIYAIFRRKPSLASA